VIRQLVTSKPYGNFLIRREVVFPNQAVLFAKALQFLSGALVAKLIFG
jgi:hypothetical protein